MRARIDTAFIKLFSNMPISIVDEKRIIINNILTAVVILGAVLVLVTFLRDTTIGFSISNSVVNLLSLVALIVLHIFGRNINYEKKGWIVIVIFLFIGTKSMILSSYEGLGFHFFLFSSLVALMIFDTRKVWAVVIVSGSMYFIITTLFMTHTIEPVMPPRTTMSNNVGWYSEMALFIFLLFIIIAGVGRLQRSFLLSIHELDETNQKLNQNNEELRNQLEYSRQMENKVTEKEINFKTLFEESNDGIIVCDSEGRILEANKAISTMLDYPKSFLIGNPSIDFVISDDKRAISQLAIDKIRHSKIRELYVVGKSGSKIPVEVNYSVIRFNEQKSILVTIRDIRERKQTEQRVLSAVIQAEENERSRFAKDLHDDLGPILSSIKMYIQSLRNHEDVPEKKDLINRLVNTVDDSIKSIRKISYNLSSHLLQNMGLINALKTHIERINLSNTFQIDFKHNFSDDMRLSSNIEIVTYRVLLELMNNSITHSQGNMISIDLHVRNDQFIISYSDNGIGFDIDRILHDNSKGIGLRNILSRVKSIKGLLTFETQKNGFSLVIDITL
jgi:PAS domain S-box-containing protein